MNQLSKLLILTLFTVGCPVSWADIVAPLTTFTSNTPAKASEVNDNFSAIKTAVDDNATDITTKQNQISGNCALGTSIRAIAADGSVTCDAGQSVISVNGHAFSSELQFADHATKCYLTKNYTIPYVYFRGEATATSVSCDAVAGIQLPHGATLSQLDCTVYDNSPNNSLKAHLKRVSSDGSQDGLIEDVYITGTSTDGVVPQTISSTVVSVVGADVVDNSTYSYFLTVDWGSTDFSTLDADGRLLSCKVSLL